MVYTRVNGVNLTYSDRGKRHDQALLLIHGFPLSRLMWRRQLLGLFPQVRVIAPDLRGAGNAEVPDPPYTMDAYADDQAALLDRLGIERAVVGGLSMGGYVALAFWRRHPARVRALVLLDTRAEPDSPEGQAQRDAAIAKVQQGGTEVLAREMLPRMLSPHSLQNERLSAAVLALMQMQPAPGVIAALQALRDRPDSRPTLPSITVPTLVVVGRDDAMTPPSAAQAMATAIPGARLLVVPDAGHLSPLENPRAVNGALRTFLRDLPA